MRVPRAHSQGRACPTDNAGDGHQTWHLLSPPTSRTVQRRLSPSSVSAPRSLTVSLRLRYKRGRPRTAQHRPRRYCASRGANLRLHRLLRRSRRSARCSQRNRTARPRCRCIRARWSSRHIRVTLSRRGSARSGVWRALRSIGVCRLSRRRRARSRLSGGSGVLRSSSHAGTGMLRIALPSTFLAHCLPFLFCSLLLLFSDALRLQSNSPDVLTLRGLVLFLCGRLPQALQHAQSALRFDPGHEPAQRLRKRVKDVERLKEEGNRAFKLGMLHDALSRYTDALEVRSLHL